ncbi:MAG: TetR family transcriptional regulator [Melioribacteraceae bacterium]|nr:TetR family transcriptional regulator [Melioribacteraceae bacterium]
MKRTKEEALKTRELLLQCAVKVFNEKGYANATLSDIAEEAELTRGAIYHHFGNKDDFIDAIIQTNKDRINFLVQEVLDSKEDIFAALKKVFSTLLAKLETDKFFRSSEELLLKMQLSGDLSHHKCKLHDAANEGFKQLHKAFEEAKEKGLISKDKDSNNFTVQIISAYLGTFITWLIHPEIVSLQKDGTAILDRVIENIKI